MRIEMTPEVRGVVNLAVLEMSDLRIAPSTDEFWTYAEEVFSKMRKRYEGTATGAIEELAEVRKIYKATGLDPTKNRPSCEALVRRTLRGKELYRINNLVDTLNLCSIHLMMPVCAHDMATLQGDVRVRIGREGESYQGIGAKTEVKLHRRLVLEDELGPFGNPSADSDRAKITQRTTGALVIFYVPPAGGRSRVEKVLKTVTAELQRWCGGTVIA